MRKAISTMKSLAVDFERDGKSDKASELRLFNPHPTSPVNPLTPPTARAFFHFR
jgi:hypothetical protein